MDFTFDKTERLCSKKAIDELFANGKSKTQFPIKLIYKSAEFESEFPARVVFIVPKKKHKRANKRNTLRRRIREVYRLNKQTFYDTLVSLKVDLMFVYLSNESLDYKQIEVCVKSLLAQVSKQLFDSSIKTE